MSTPPQPAPPPQRPEPGPWPAGHEAPTAYGPPPPPQPPYLWYAYTPPRTNGLAVASLVLGILWIYWLGSILALVFGYVARRQIRERNEAGAGLATAGIVLGWVGVGILSAGLAIAAIATAADASG